MVDRTFAATNGIEPSKFPEITFYTHQKGHLTEEKEARAREGGRLPNNDLPQHQDHFMEAHPHEMLFEYYTLPRGSDSGFFLGGGPESRLYRSGIKRGYRKFRTRKYDMLMWQITRKSGERDYELVEIIFHYPLLLSRIGCTNQ